MALTKVQADGINLADTFAFTGTVSGTDRGLVQLLDATISSEVAEYDISSTYINSTYDTYKLIFHLLNATDDVDLYMYVFVGGTRQTGSIYASEVNPTDGGSVFNNNGTTYWRINRYGIGNASGEGYGGVLYLRNVNSTTIPCMFEGVSNGFGTAADHQGASTTGSLLPANRADVVNGLRLSFSGGNVASGTIKLYGIKE
mgnify:CR=1 FL=1